MTEKHPGEAESIGGGFNAINYVMSIARQVGARKLSSSVRSKNACKACAFGTGGQRGGLHHEHSSRVEICKKNHPGATKRSSRAHSATDLLAKQPRRTAPADWQTARRARAAFTPGVQGARNRPLRADRLRQGAPNDRPKNARDASWPQLLLRLRPLLQ